MLFTADEETGQMSFELLKDISINNRGMTINYFAAKSLGHSVRGYLRADRDSDYEGGVAASGEIDILTLPTAKNTI